MSRSCFYCLHALILFVMQEDFAQHFATHLKEKRKVAKRGSPRALLLLEVLEEYQIIRPNLQSCVKGLEALFAAANQHNGGKETDMNEPIEIVDGKKRRMDETGQNIEDAFLDENNQRKGKKRKKNHNGIHLSHEGRNKRGDALCVLGILWEEGIILRKEELKALKCFKIATDMGHPVAQCILGKLYATGKLVEKDSSLSFHYYELAAAQGNPAAICNLAAIYRLGRDGVVDQYVLFLYYILFAVGITTKQSNY